MPAISAIVTVPDGISTVRVLLQHLRAQTLRDLEIVLVVPKGALAPSDHALVQGFAAVQIVEQDRFSNSSARAAGIRAATAPLVVLTEDHSLPEPEWAAALVQAHQAEWAAVGPEVLNGNPATWVSWANFLMEYGEWSAPATPGEAAHLPGHNSAYRRDVLLSLGDSLTDWLEVETLLHWHLRTAGHRLALEPRARTHHFNFSRLLPSLKLRLKAGRLFGATRGRPWAWSRRLLYAAGSPVIPTVRLARLLRLLHKQGWPTERTARVLPWLWLFLVADATGELTGYLFGTGNAARYVDDIDFHRERFMVAAERTLLT